MREASTSRSGENSSQIPSSTPELSIFPAFTPDLIRLAELVGSATYSPPVSPIAAEAKELFASIKDGQKFFELLERDEKVDILHCVDGRRRTLLHQACRCGNIQVAKCLLFHGANASAQCRDGRTPFHDAAVLSTSKTAVELLKLLFEHDTNGISIVDAYGAHVLHLAAIHGNLEVVQWCASLLSQSSVNRSCTQSYQAIIPHYLIPLGVTSFNGRNILHYAAYNGHLNVLKWLFDNKNLRQDELILNTVDTKGYSVLHYAAMGAPLEVCEWLVLEAPQRRQLSLNARTNDGKTVVELASARPITIMNFLFEASKVPSVPSEVRCLGADTTSFGVGWEFKPTRPDTKLWETLKPLDFHLEICKKPASLSRASNFLTMLMLMPPATSSSPQASSSVSSAVMSASNLLDWKPLDVLLQPEAREHWICGLEKDTEYLVRVRARNRNGFSGYSVPNLSGVFTTRAGSRSCSISSLQRFFGVIKMDPPKETIAISFIGDLHLELIEARGLPTGDMDTMIPSTLRTERRRYYGVISVETPSTPDININGSSRVLYCIRSPLGSLQQDFVLSGSSQVWRHPRFGLSSVFRAPESLAHTQITITVHQESERQSDSSCVGRLTVSMLDLVQGMPAKLQWLQLVNTRNFKADGGLVLIRTLFLPDGISEIPHLTIPETWGSTAKKLLSTLSIQPTEKGYDCHSPPGSSSSTASTSSTSSCSSQYSHSSMIDRLGFGVFDPELQLRNGDWQPNPGTKSYAYYRLLIEALERQEESKWRSFSYETVGYCGSNATRQQTLREMIWRGIPMSRRLNMYSELSGASIAQGCFPRDYFPNLIKRLEDPTDEIHFRAKSSRFTMAKKQIEVDLKRTFAGNDECWITSHAGQRSLERVMLAYALHNDALGYCQSMTFVVGRLLCLSHAQIQVDKIQNATDLPIEEEERIFWLLHAICEEYFPAYYTQGMTGLQVDGAVLDRLLRSRLPKLYRHFQQLNAPPMGLVLVTQWMLPLCCAVFPSETTFRFLDILFFEKSSVIFAMAIALLRISQHELIAENTDYTQLFRFLRARDQRLHDAPLLMEVVYDEHQVVSDQIDSLRKKVARELGISQCDSLQRASTLKLASLVDELRPGDVDV